MANGNQKETTTDVLEPVAPMQQMSRPESQPPGTGRIAPLGAPTPTVVQPSQPRVPQALEPQQQIPTPVVEPRVEHPKVRAPTPNQPTATPTPEPTVAPRPTTTAPRPTTAPPPTQPERPVVAEPVQTLEQISATPPEPIDTQGKTTQGVQRELLERETELFTQRQLAINQAQIQAYQQQLAQRGFGTSGARNALVTLLEASQNTQLTEGIQELQLESFRLGVAEEREQKANFMTLFDDLRLNGNINEAIDLATSMAELFPDDSFLNGIANDPNIQESLRKAGDRNFQQRLVEANQNARSVIARIPDINDSSQVNDAFDQWQNIFFFDDDELGIKADSFFRRGDITDQELNEISQEMFGRDAGDPSQLSEQMRKDIYARWAYNNQVQQLQSELVRVNLVENLIEQGATPDENVLEQAQQYSSIIANSEVAQNLALGGVRGEFTADPAQGVFGFLFQDWDGLDYDPETNSINQRDNFNRSMDNLWIEMTKKLKEGDELPTREEFKTEFEAIAKDANADGRFLQAAESRQLVNTFIENRRAATRAQVIPGFTDLAAQQVISDISPEAAEVASGQASLDNLAAVGTNRLRDILNSPSGGQFMDALQQNTDIGTTNQAQLDTLSGTVEDPRFGLKAIKEGTVPEFVIIDGQLFKVNTSTKQFKKDFEDTSRSLFTTTRRTAVQGVLDFVNMSDPTDTRRQTTNSIWKAAFDAGAIGNKWTKKVTPGRFGTKRNSRSN